MYYFFIKKKIILEALFVRQYPSQVKNKFCSLRQRRKSNVLYIIIWRVITRMQTTVKKILQELYFCGKGTDSERLILSLRGFLTASISKE